MEKCTSNNKSIEEVKLCQQKVYHESTNLNNNNNNNHSNHNNSGKSGSNSNHNNRIDNGNR